MSDGPTQSGKQERLPPLLRKVYQDDYIGVWRATSTSELEAMGWRVRSYAIHPDTGEFADWPVRVTFAEDDPPIDPTLEALARLQARAEEPIDVTVSE